MNNITTNHIDVGVCHDSQNSTLGTISSEISVNLPDHGLSGRQILEEANCHPVDDFILLQLTADRHIHEIDNDQVVPSGGPWCRFFAIREDRLYFFVLDNKKLSWGRMLPETLLRRLVDTPDCVEFVMKHADGSEVLLSAGSHIDLAVPGVEHFFTKPRLWKLDVQGKVIISDSSTISVRRALELAKINPDLPWTFILKIEGRPKEQVSLDFIIDLRMPGIERLRVMPKVIKNGEAPNNRRQFALLDRDTKFLDEAGFHWETTLDGGRRWLLIHQFKLPVGYTERHTTLAIEIPLLYPAAELDMFYCAPFALLQSGRVIDRTESRQVIFEVEYQRWSRHREDDKVWSPSDDSVITHLGLVEESFAREVA